MSPNARLHWAQLAKLKRRYRNECAAQATAQGAKHEDVIPLCPGHHRGRTGIPGLGTKGFAECYGFDEADLLADTKRRLQ